MFSGRSKALIVDGRGNGYLKTVCDYVHLNPVRAKLLRPEQRWLEYPWSSFGLYLAAPAPRPAWLRVDPPRRMEAVEMARGRTASAAQDRPGEAGDSRTVARETTLPLPWIAARLHLGTWKSLNAKLHRWRKANEKF